MGNAIYRKEKTNNPNYQQWSSYPQSPKTLSEFPHQTICIYGTTIFLWMAVGEIYKDGSYIAFIGTDSGYYYNLVGGEWLNGSSKPLNSNELFTSILESNTDVYSNATLTTVYFYKTTTTSQDAGISENNIRVRNLRHKTSISSEVRARGVYHRTGVMGETGIKEISNGFGHSIIIKTDGSMWGVGLNTSGQLGLGDATNRQRYTKIGEDYDWDLISCGSSHTFAIKTDGTVWATGNNVFGQLGTGDNFQRNSFVKVNPFPDWAKVACGSNHTLILNIAGTIWSTGDNSRGQLGLGDNVNKNTFTQTSIITDWSEISCGQYHSSALRTDGTYWATGNNDYGQLGVGSYLGDSYNTFVQYVTAPIGYSNISCGNFHTMAIGTDNTLWATGRNTEGQHGTGSIYNTEIAFVQVGSDTDWENVACGQLHTIAKKNDDSIWGAGKNNVGQLAIADTSDQRTIFKISESISGDTISFGHGDFSIIIDNENKIYGTGYNQYYQLGNGENTNSFEFVESIVSFSQLNSPDSLSVFPYQTSFLGSSFFLLICTNNKQYVSDEYISVGSGTHVKVYGWNGSEWELSDDIPSYEDEWIMEKDAINMTSADIYTDNTFTTVYFKADIGISESENIRINL